MKIRDLYRLAGKNRACRKWGKYLVRCGGLDREFDTPEEVAAFFDGDGWGEKYEVFVRLYDADVVKLLQDVP